MRAVIFSLAIFAVCSIVVLAAVPDPASPTVDGNQSDEGPFVVNVTTINQPDDGVNPPAPMCLLDTLYFQFAANSAAFQLVPAFKPNWFHYKANSSDWLNVMSAIVFPNTQDSLSHVEITLNGLPINSPDLNPASGISNAGSVAGSPLTGSTPLNFVQGQNALLIRVVSGAGLAFQCSYEYTIAFESLRGDGQFVVNDTTIDQPDDGVNPSAPMCLLDNLDFKFPPDDATFQLVPAFKPNWFHYKANSSDWSKVLSAVVIPHTQDSQSHVEITLNGLPINSPDFNPASGISNAGSVLGSPLTESAPLNFANGQNTLLVRVVSGAGLALQCNFQYSVVFETSNAHFYVTTIDQPEDGVAADAVTRMCMLYTLGFRFPPDDATFQLVPAFKPNVFHYKANSSDWSKVLSAIVIPRTQDSQSQVEITLNGLPIALNPVSGISDGESASLNFANGQNTLLVSVVRSNGLTLQCNFQYSVVFNYSGTTAEGFVTDSTGTTNSVSNNDGTEVVVGTNSMGNAAVSHSSNASFLFAIYMALAAVAMMTLFLHA